MSNLRDFTGKNRVFTGVEGIILPAGNDAQRPVSPALGTLRYNTEATKGFLEQYNAAGWGAIDAPPTVLSVSPINYSGNAGQVFTVTGSNFKSASTVSFLRSDNVEVASSSTTFVNSTTLIATVASDITVAQGPVGIKVANPSGLSNILVSAITTGTVPTFTSPSASAVLGTVTSGASLTEGLLTQIVTDDTEDSSLVTLSVNFTTDSASITTVTNGYLIGTAPTAASSPTNYTITVTATDTAGNTATRSFVLTVDDTYTAGGNYVGSGVDN
jgi:hypothetical protein